jgi:tryptophanyl-tRNA synthetase
MTDDAETIAKKIRKAKTDQDALPSEVDGLEGRPEARNLVNIFAAIANKTPTEVLGEFGGQQFGQFKPALVDLAVDHLSPISAEMTRLMSDPAEIDRVLGDGADRAAAIAEPILADTYDILGMVRSRR